MQISLMVTWNELLADTRDDIHMCLPDSLVYNSAQANAREVLERLDQLCKEISCCPEASNLVVLASTYDMLPDKSGWLRVFPTDAVGMIILGKCKCTHGNVWNQPL